MTVENLATLLHRLPRDMEIGINVNGHLIRNLQIGNKFVSSKDLDDTRNPELNSFGGFMYGKDYDTEVITIGNIG